MNSYLRSLIIISSFLISLFLRTSFASDSFNTPKIPVDFRNCIDTYKGFESSVKDLDGFTDESISILNSSKNPYQAALAKTNAQGIHLNDQNTLSVENLNTLGKTSKNKFDEAQGLSARAQLRMQNAMKSNQELAQYLTQCNDFLIERMKNLKKVDDISTSALVQLGIMNGIIGMMEYNQAKWTWQNEGKCSGHNYKAKAETDPSKIQEKILKHGTLDQQAQVLQGNLAAAWMNEKGQIIQNVNGVNTHLSISPNGNISSVLNFVKKHIPLPPGVDKAFDAAAKRNLLQEQDLTLDQAKKFSDGITPSEENIEIAKNNDAGGCLDSSYYKNLAGEIGSVASTLLLGPLKDLRSETSKLSEDASKYKNSNTAITTSIATSTGIAALSATEFTALGVLGIGCQSVTLSGAGAAACATEWHGKKVLSVAKIGALLATATTALFQTMTLKHTNNKQMNEVALFISDYQSNIEPINSISTKNLANLPTSAHMIQAANEGSKMSQGNLNGTYKSVHQSTPIQENPNPIDQVQSNEKRKSLDKNQSNEKAALSLNQFPYSIIGF